MNTLKLFFAVLMVALALPSFADGEDKVTVASVSTSVEESRPVNILPSYPLSRTYTLRKMTDCVVLPGGSVSSTKTLRGSSGLTEISYSLLGSDEEVPFEQVCLGVVHVRSTSVLYETDVYVRDYMEVIEKFITRRDVFWIVTIPTPSWGEFDAYVSGFKTSKIHIFGLEDED